MRASSFLFLSSLLLGSFPALPAANPAGPGLVRIPGTSTQVRLLEVKGLEAYQVSLDGGRTWSRILPSRTLVRLHFATFDPLAGLPPVPGNLLAPRESRLFLVQFRTQTLPAYDRVLEKLGAEVEGFIPDQAYLVRMAPSLREKVESLPFVRWVGPYHPAYRLEPALLEAIRKESLPEGRAKYNLVLVNPKGRDRVELAAQVEDMGGRVATAPEDNLLIEARLAPSQLVRAAALDTVKWIDRWSEGEVDMDLARKQGGADYIEFKKPSHYTGKGIRGMIMEGIYSTHPEFGPTSYRTWPLVLHDGSPSGHGTATFGEVFAKGVRPKARGLLPDGQGIYCNYRYVYNNNRRYTVVKELTDPNLKYRGMFQTASWGYARTTLYTSRSAEMDKIIFDLDLPITQSQSNAGATSNPRMSRPQAWAKNIISVGGVRHYNTLTTSDDRWGRSGSTGPASDGRIKPDLCAYYDYIYTTGYSSSSYTSSFGGTSGATPIVAGYVGLSIELYTDGVFGHPMPGGAAKRFENRPHFSTTKALMINTARQYPFPNYKDFTRFNQGWGFPSVQDMWDLRKKMHVVNEWDVLKVLQSKDYFFYVRLGEPMFRVTMTFPDPAANPSSSKARINDLDLQVADPRGAIYWGNQGLKSGNYSTPGGSPDHTDTVENVFVKSPLPGIWRVRVRASQVNQDGHEETPAKDVDYALVASGIASGRDRSHMTLDLTSTGKGDLTAVLKNLPAGWKEGWTLLSISTRLPSGLGPFLGIEADGLTAAVLVQPAQAGSLLHFKATSNPALFPNAPFQVPAGVLSALKGRSIDGVTLVVDGKARVLDVSNASRVTF